jgi:3-dehydroquinate dehydratase II
MHGANLDQLGRRDPGHYGSLSLPALEDRVTAWATERHLVVRFFTTNHEGDFVEHLHRLDGVADGLVLNPGAWSHYAWAVRDALEIAALPAVEVHLSDVQAREAWRRTSVLADLCLATVSGRGADGYRKALELLATELSAPA